MMYLFFQNRHSFREARLCFKFPEVPAGSQPTPEWQKTVVNFCKDVPFLRTYFDRLPAIKNEQALRKLSDHAEWIKTFRKDPFVKIQNPTILDGKEDFGPDELLESLSVEDRLAIYDEYLKKFIPEQQLKTLASEESFQTRNWTMGETQKLNAALGGIFGMSDYMSGIADPTEQKTVNDAVDASLRGYYKLNDPDAAYSKGLEDDYLLALRLQKASNISQVATDPAKLQKTISASQFKGALMRGIVNTNDLQVLSSQMQGLKDLKNESLANVSRHLDRLSGESKEKAKQEAETLFAGFSKLGGFEKSLLIGLGAVLLWKSKGARWFAGTIAGAYFFQKLVLKSKDPVATWSNMLGAAVSPSKAAAADIVGAQNIPGLIDDSSMRAKTIMNFLDDYSLEYIERQTIGFTFLNDLPLSMLSRQFQIDEGGAFGLSVDSPAMKLAMREAASRHGWKNGAEQFFADPTNRAQAAEAMSYTFFLYAAQNPQNATRSEKVMEALRALPSGAGLSTFVRIAEGNLDGIPEELHPQMIEAAAEFRSLILDGQVMAAGSTESLGAFMGRAVGYETFGLASDTASQTANNRRTNPGGAGGAGGAGGGNGGGGAPGGAQNTPNGGGNAPPPKKNIKAEDEPPTGVRPENEPPTGVKPEAEPRVGTTPENEPKSGTADTEPAAGSRAEKEPRTGGQPEKEPGSSKVEKEGVSRTKPDVIPPTGPKPEVEPASGTKESEPKGSSAPEKEPKPSRAPAEPTSGSKPF